MACFPEAQRKGQAEIDRVIGSERLPTMEDEYDLPYIRAMVKETLRWMPTTVTGALPHAATKEGHYNGYFIPEGAELMNNVWTIHMDEAHYPNPREFQPERYEGDNQTAADSAANPDARKRDHFGFGAGRRICPGLHVAERSLFLGISRILWGFSIAPKTRDGIAVPINTERLTQGFVCMPDIFECDIRPRDEKREKKIRDDWHRCVQDYLDPSSFQIKSDVNLTNEILT